MLSGEARPLTERLACLVDDRPGIFCSEACLFGDGEQMRPGWRFAFTLDHRGLLAAWAGGEGQVIGRG